MSDLTCRQPPRSDGWWRWVGLSILANLLRPAGELAGSDFYVSTFWQSISGESWTFIFGASKETSTEIFVNPAEGCAQSPRVNSCSCLRARGLHNTFHGHDHEVGASPLVLFEQPASGVFQQPPKNGVEILRPFEEPHGRLPRWPLVPSPSRNPHERKIIKLLKLVRSP